ncbi:hypothetical protein BC937DRAFT_92696 [Endogone sp. FLAS-F59071]|nr:hypothetical protein BC937DRAFT_92696 [Endogone sp. FLAS-F59071]|eukprot:RUS15252.1 hypothetical protein BC937DRAFT_92696 [Endogone sp. FLAS-F59071]
MHYCGMAGTQYYMPDHTSNPPSPPIHRLVLVGLITAVVVSGCSVLVGITIQGRREKDLVRQRARQIVLEIVVFDEWGKVLVTNDGILPMKDIDQKLYTKNRQLSIFEPVFNRLFELTRDWKESTSATHILRSTIIEPLKPNEEDHFVRRFIDVAQQLAGELKLCLFEMGILYDNVLNTGVIDNSKRSRRNFLNFVNPRADGDGELQIAMVTDMRGGLQFRSKGQHLFLVQKLRRGESAQRFTQLGYRFSDPIFISDIMASKLSVPRDVMLGYFHDLWSYVTTGMEMRPAMTARSKGVYMGLLMVIQEKNEKENLQIVVDKANRYSLPLVEIMGEDVPDSRPPLNIFEREYIRGFFDKSLEEVASEPTNSNIPANFHHFTRAVNQAARLLLDNTNLPNSPVTKAILHPSIIDLPPFSLTRSTSQLLLFTCHVPSADLGAAINDDQALRVYCLPWKFYQSFWRVVSDVAFHEYVAQSRAKLHQRTVEFHGSARSLPPPPRPGPRIHRTKTSTSTTSERSREPIDSGTNIAMSNFCIDTDNTEELLLSANRMQWLTSIVKELAYYRRVRQKHQHPYILHL